VGIPNAPDSLPDSGSLIGLPWSVCSAPRSRTGESVDLATHLIPGRVPAGGQPLPDADGLLVSAVDSGELYLLWHNQRLAIKDRSVATALGYPVSQALRAAPAFLDALTVGANLAVVQLPGAGQTTSHPLNGAPTAVGDLFHDAGADVYYVMTVRGLVRVGHVTARLLQELAGAVVEPISARDVDAALDVTASVEPPGLPDAIPTLRGSDNVATACASYRGDTDPQSAVTVEVYERVPDDIPDITAPAAGSRTLADRVALPGGRGALVQTLLPPGVAARGPLFLITDQGVRYPLGGTNPDSTKQLLGYASVTPILLPSLFLDLIPVGVELDPDKALNLSGPASTEPTPSAAVSG
jgi:type VII secretion protein EccB